MREGAGRGERRQRKPERREEREEREKKDGEEEKRLYKVVPRENGRKRERGLLRNGRRERGESERGQITDSGEKEEAMELLSSLSLPSPLRGEASESLAACAERRQLFGGRRREEGMGEREREGRGGSAR
eukprot:scaffold31501_cov32-Tisochrysis_lutea.AAC.1